VRLGNAPRQATSRVTTDENGFRGGIPAGDGRLAMVVGGSAAFGERLYAERLARIHWTTPEEEREAFAYFKKHRDKDYSIVDCLSFVVMERDGIREALTVDSDFTHRFTARPSPAR
jgi:hypothetical protein